MRALLVATTVGLVLLFAVAAEAAREPRIVGRPEVVFTGASPDRTHDFTFFVFVRLDRPLRRTRDAVVDLDGDPSFVVFRAAARRPCYGAEIANHDDPSPAPRRAAPARRATDAGEPACRRPSGRACDGPRPSRGRP